jgi:hypothetical protein
MIQYFRIRRIFKKAGLTVLHLIIRFTVTSEWILTAYILTVSYILCFI